VSFGSILGTTKNLEVRRFFMTPELRSALETQRAVTDAKEEDRKCHPLGIPPY